MTDHTLPSAGTVVELSADDRAPLHGVRVVAAGDAVVTLSMAASDAPAAGDPVTLRWPAGPRGRYALSGAVRAVEESRVEVVASGAPLIEQHRNFVRGGGGEHVLLLKPGSPDALGWIRDLSEQGIRAHFADIEVVEGDEVRLRIQLDVDVIEVRATTAKVAALRQRVPQRGPMSVELVAVLTPDETQAQAIRRYVLRQQLLARARTGGS